MTKTDPKVRRQRNYNSDRDLAARGFLTKRSSQKIRCSKGWRGSGLMAVLTILMAFSKFYTGPADARGMLQYNIAVASNANLPDSAPLMAGDQVKVQFFSPITLKTGKKTGAPGETITRTSLYERADLSGNFTIAGNGTLSHPKFGLIKAKGKHLHELEKLLKKLHRKSTGKKIEIRATFVMRPPIYVAGLVKHPGAYKYMQGMTVMQVVTLASGLYRPGEGRQPSEMIMRERAIIEKTEQLLIFALVRKAQLQAVLNNQKNIKTSAKLNHMVGKAEARKLIRSENKLFQRTKQSRALYRQRMLEAKKLASAEIKTIVNQKRNFLNQQKVVERKLLRFRKLYRRSRVRASMAADKEMAQFELLHLNLKNEQTKLSSSMIQAKYKINKIEQDLAALDVKELTKVKADMDNLAVQLIEYEANLSTARAALGDFASKAKRTQKKPNAKQHLAFELTRRSAGHFNTFAASSNTFVRPGDVIKVKYKARELASGHSLQQ